MSGRKNKHHVFAKSRVREFTRDRIIKKISAKEIKVELYDAFHNLFFNDYTWEVIKKLRRWAQEQRPGSNTKNEEPFFAQFTAKQHESFVLLFDCQPSEFMDNGHLTHAIEVVEIFFMQNQSISKKSLLPLKTKKVKNISQCIEHGLFYLF